MNFTTILKSKIILFFVVFSSLVAFSQEETKVEKKTTVPPVALYDLFKSRDSLKVRQPKSKKNLIVLPTLGYQPANGFTFGFISQYSFKKKFKDEVSLISGGASYSSKKQILSYIKNNMYLNKDQIFLTGDLRYYVFSQSNFGLGSKIVPYGDAFDDFDYAAIEEPMKYNYFKFHQTANCELLPHIYAGLGIHIDSYDKIEDELLDIASQETTVHYDYSKRYGFNDKQYSVIGGSLNLIYNTRDNLINTNKGLFINLNYRYNPKINASQQHSTTLTLDTRYFIPMSSTNKQHVLAFWTYGQFLTSGNLPYLNLPSIGWDQNNRSGKGYIQGLFRGANLICFETEYRFPVTQNQLISSTFFVNATTASDIDGTVALFDSFQPAVGVGVRILLNKDTFTNFIANFGLGRKSKTFYFNDGEAF